MRPIPWSKIDLNCIIYPTMQQTYILQTLVMDDVQLWRADICQIHKDQPACLPRPVRQLMFVQQKPTGGAGVSHPQCITAAATALPCLYPDRGWESLPHWICSVASLVFCTILRLKYWRLNAIPTFIVRLQAWRAVQHVSQRSGWVLIAAFVDDAKLAMQLATLGNVVAVSSR